MRLSIFALFLYTGTMAFCQSATPAPANPGKMNQPPRIFNWSANDSGKTPPAWLSNSVSPQPMIVLRNPAPALRMENAQIDPRMIIHPPKSSLGVQPKGTLMATDQFPGLRFLPIEISSLKLEPIPTPWPNLKLQPIPIVWPNLKALPVDSRAPNPKSAPAK